MFDIAWGEFVVIGAVALIVIGPKELPKVLRTVGQWTTKVRRMAAEFQSQFQEALREAEMADLKKEVESLGDVTKGLADFDPLESAQPTLWAKDEAAKGTETQSALDVFGEAAPASAAPPVAGGAEGPGPHAVLDDAAAPGQDSGSSLAAASGDPRVTQVEEAPVIAAAPAEMAATGDGARSAAGTGTPGAEKSGHA